MRIDSAGVTPTELAVYKTALENVFRAAFGEDLVLASETPQGQLIGIMALSLAEVDEVAVAVANGLSLQHASGLQLDALGSLLGLRRIGQERSTVTVTVTGTAGTIIEAGALARTAAGDQFALDNRIVIPSGGSISAGMRSVDYGPIVAAAGALSMIVTVVSGWTGITNAAAATPGRNAETGPEYRARMAFELARNSRDGLEAIRGRVLSVEGVTRALVVENATASTVTVQGFDIAARSIFVVAEGGTDADVAAAIFAAKPAGIGTSGSTTVAVEHARSRETDVDFERVVLEPIAVSLETVPGPDFPAGGISLIRDRCAAWVAGTFEAIAGNFDRGGLGIGEDIDTQRLFTAVQSVPGHTVDFSTYSVTLAGGGTLPTSLALNKRYTLAVTDVAITILTP